MRVHLDSGEVLVGVSSRAASITVVAPSGTFLLAFSTSEPLADWADKAVSLDMPMVAADTSHGLVFASVQLNTPGDTASRFDLTTFRLTRVGRDEKPEYLLTGTNGAWPFRLHADSAQFVALVSALYGVPHPGAIPFGLPMVGKTPGTSTPDAEGAWLDLDLDRVAVMESHPALPRMVEGGTVRLDFIVGASGRVTPSSVRLLGKAHPQLALVARDVLLRATFRPAELAGRQVPQRLIQEFVFH